jgi:putative DNA methylase
MAIYSRYSKVLEANGSSMSIRAALQLINQELGSYFEGQEGELDPESRFCLALYAQCGFSEMKYGQADVEFRAKGTSDKKLVSAGVLYAQKGVVRLLERAELPEKSKDAGGTILWLLTQRLTKALETGGKAACVSIVAAAPGGAPDRAKALAYRLFIMAEKKGWAQEALAYNSLVIAWPEIQAQVGDIEKQKPVQATLF